MQYLQSVALAKRWTGQAEYRRFIVLGRSRVGSNFLRGLLNAHPQITVLGEVFQNKQEIGWAMDGFPKNGRAKSLFLHQPVQFLETKVWRNFPVGVTAVGFKLFYYHARDPEWEPVWEYLRGDTALHIIHIKRHNMLKTHLSRKRASYSDEWVKTANGRQKKVGAIALDYDECVADFEQTQTWAEQTQAYFKDQPQLDLTYETLAADYEGEMRRIQAFLGVDYQDVEPQTLKQRSKPLRDTITNYDDLKARFAGSPWERFFEE